MMGRKFGEALLTLSLFFTLYVRPTLAFGVGLGPSCLLAKNIGTPLVGGASPFLSPGPQSMHRRMQSSAPLLHDSSSPPPPPLAESDLEESSVYFFDTQTRTHVYLVGTFHISSASAEDVRHVIEMTKPSLVMLELCPSRYVSMLGSRKTKAAADRNRADGEAEGKDRKPTKVALKSGTRLLAKVLSTAYRSYQRVGLKPGQEFEAAQEAAAKVGARLVLGDADAFNTIENLASVGNVWKSGGTFQTWLEAWGSLVGSFVPASGGRLNVLKLFADWERLKELLALFIPVLIGGTLFACGAWELELLLGVEEASHRAVDDVIFAIPLLVMLLITPGIYRTLIGARDEHLLTSLLECCQLRHHSQSNQPTVSAGAVEKVLRVENGQQRSQGGEKGEDHAVGISIAGMADLREDVVVGVVGLLHVNGMLKVSYFSGVGVTAVFSMRHVLIDHNLPSARWIPLLHVYPLHTCLHDIAKYIKDKSVTLESAR